jgi:glutaredoxin
MYVKPNCPYCENARQDLNARGVEFVERDATTNNAWRADLMRLTNGRGTVPTIVLEDGSKQVGFPPGRG